MKDINIWQTLPGTERSIVTLGKFDGLHRGHLRLIEQVCQGSQNGLASVIFIFDVASRTLLTKDERRARLQKMGMDYLVECPLDEKIRQMSAEDFVRKILVGNLRIAKVVVGEDFRFGFQRKGSPALLRELGRELDFTVEVVPSEMDGKRKISSTFVREQLNEGNMEKVRELLGVGFCTTGEVLHGRGLGHRKLIPTTNLVPPKEKLMPPNGVYVTRSTFGNKTFEGITNVGYKPTVGGETFLGVETYLFYCDEDLYGRISKVEFFKFLRSEQQFPSLEALKKQLLIDTEKGKEYFNRIREKSRLS